MKQPIRRLNISKRTNTILACMVIAAALAVGYGVIGQRSNQSSQTAARQTTAAGTIPQTQTVPTNTSSTADGLSPAATDTTKSSTTTKTSSPQTGQQTTVTLYENSGTSAVNVLQADIRYPANKLELVSVTNGPVFTIAAATDTSTAGKVLVARAVTAGQPAVSGQQSVLSVTFKKLTKVDAASVVTVDPAASLLVSADTNKSILGTSGTSMEIH